MPLNDDKAKSTDVNLDEIGRSIPINKQKVDK